MSKKNQNEESNKNRVDEEPLEKQGSLMDEQNQTDENAQNAREKPELKPSRIQTRSK